MPEVGEFKALRKDFPKTAIGKLPKPYKKDSPKGDCRECGGYHGLPAMHLDYVGHAAVTDRLLEVDPYWTWRPMGFTEHGLPQYDAQGGLWIWLTILGVTRPGYGDGPDPKQVISDAIRNGAMRFGVALSLWSREELESSAGVGPNESDLGGVAGATPAAPVDTASGEGDPLGAPPLGEEGGEQAPSPDILEMTRNFFDICADLKIKPLPTFIQTTDSSVRYNDLKEGNVDPGDLAEALAHVTAMALQKKGA
jgi:hypothetical protein